MGVLVNGLAIVVASFIGIFMRKGIPERIHDGMMTAIGLAVLLIGINGAIQGQETLVMILSIVIGAFIGEMIDIDRRVIQGVDKLKDKFLDKESDSDRITQGFLSAAMIFCIGSMAIIGSLESGLTGDNSTLYTKSVLDGITSFLLASSLGHGVLLSAIPVVIWQGFIYIFATILEPLLSAAIITEVISVGSILLIGLGLNMVNATDLKIMNYTPAIFMPMILMLFF